MHREFGVVNQNSFLCSLRTLGLFCGWDVITVLKCVFVGVEFNLKKSFAFLYLEEIH